MQPSQARGAAGPRRPDAGRARATLTVALLALLGLAAWAGWALGALGGDPPPPPQPIAFSHRVHAGDVGIDCQYCHSGARRAAAATLPAVSTCLGCHVAVLPESEEVQKIHDHRERGEAIPWRQVYDLPEFVRFTHEPHVRAGVECSSCHGEVVAMDLAHQVGDLSMGWCMSGHEQRDAPVDCLACHH